MRFRALHRWPDGEKEQFRVELVIRWASLPLTSWLPASMWWKWRELKHVVFGD
jgi:hypothetical protein